jgi:hypothetical protein
MKNIKYSYTISLEGNDIDVKSARTLKAGDALTLERVNDELDTYEIVVSSADGRQLDMLSYDESVGIAPFMDDGSVSVVLAQVTAVTVKEGPSRAKDITEILFSVEFSYDETAVEPFCGGYDINGFMPQDNTMLALCLYRALDYGENIITQTHLNRYEFEVDMDDDTKQFFDIDWQDEDYMFQGEVLFNESFTKCKVRSKIYSDSHNIPLETDALDAETLLTFVNHLRIFNDEKALTDCEVEL